MFSHVMVGVGDLDRAKLFYDNVLGAIGVPPGVFDRFRIAYRTPAGSFFPTLPINGEPSTVGNGGTVAFNCASKAQVDAWHDAGVAHGGTTCEDPPGMRGDTLYLAYLRDPDGNKLCGIYRIN